MEENIVILSQKIAKPHMQIATLALLVQKTHKTLFITWKTLHSITNYAWKGRLNPNTSWSTRSFNNWCLYFIHQYLSTRIVCTWKIEGTLDPIMTNLIYLTQIKVYFCFSWQAYCRYNIQLKFSILTYLSLVIMLYTHFGDANILWSPL